jgi:hypothetical protein
LAASSSNPPADYSANSNSLPNRRLYLALHNPPPALVRSETRRLLQRRLPLAERVRLGNSLSSQRREVSARLASRSNNHSKTASSAVERQTPSGIVRPSPRSLLSVAVRPFPFTR